MKNSIKKQHETRRKLLQATWTTPIVSAIAIPKHAHATFITPDTTDAPDTTETPDTTEAPNRCIDPELAAQANIEANPLITLTDTDGDWPFPQGRPEAYYWSPIEPIFNGTKILSGTDGTQNIATEIAAHTAILSITEAEMPCYLPDQEAEVCFEVTLERRFPAQTLAKGTLQMYDLNVAPGEGFGTLLGGVDFNFGGDSAITKTRTLCAPIKASRLVKGIILVITAETSRYGAPRGWQISGSYTTTWR